MSDHKIFDAISKPSVNSNRFDLSHDIKTTFRIGELVPTFVMETLPGDVVSIQPEIMLRFAPLIAPVMHRVKVTQHFFFVPNRIIWKNWEEWITGNLDVEPPYINFGVTGVGLGSKANYMGCPVASQTSYFNQKISCLPFASYVKIFDEYYRDQNLEELGTTDENWTDLIDGDNSSHVRVSTFRLDRPWLRAWNHDYFTSALPFAQKGDQVEIPLGNFSDVDIVTNPLATNPGAWLDASTGIKMGTGSVDSNSGDASVDDGTPTPAKYDPVGTLLAQTSGINLESATITNLRRAFRLQEWLELNARGGTRYKEHLKAHFGVNSSDARLQRPEYIGGSTQNVVISEVLATAQTNDGSGDTEVPVGQMAGHGISVGGGKRFKKYCEEHGHIIGIINVQPVSAYQQGLPRSFQRMDRLDYFWPTFQHIGEQEILNKELLMSTETVNNSVFGYIPRYSEYKYINSRISGEFQGSLNFWHMGRIFTSTPALNAAFIKCAPDETDRIFAVQGDIDQIYSQLYYSVSAVRKLARYGNPGL